MKIKLQVGDKETSRIDLTRHPLSGGFQILADGRLVAERVAYSLAAGFSFARVRRYEFAVGRTEKHDVVIEHETPTFLAGFRRQTYRVFTDGQLVLKRYGY